MFTGYTQENRKKRDNTEVDTAVAETQKSPKRIRLQENKKDNSIQVEVQERGYLGAAFNPLHIWISSPASLDGSPLLGPLAYAGDDCPEDVDCLLPEPLYVPTPSEAMFDSALSKAFEAFEALSFVNSPVHASTPIDNISETRSRAGAFIYKPVAVRHPLAALQLPVAVSSHEMDGDEDAVSGRSRPRAMSNLLG